MIVRNKNPYNTSKETSMKKISMTTKQVEH